MYTANESRYEADSSSGRQLCGMVDCHPALVGASAIGAIFLFSTAIAFLLAAHIASAQTVVFSDPFSSAPLDPVWQLSFVDADSWDHSIDGGALNVQGVEGTVQNSGKGGTWGKAYLQRDFDEILDFQLTADFSWDSFGDNNAYQLFDVVLLDENGSSIVRVFYGDTAIPDASRGASIRSVITGARDITIDASQTLPDAGSARLQIERLSPAWDQVLVYWDGVLIQNLGNVPDRIASVRLGFWHHDGDTLGGSPFTFGRISVDAIQLEGTPAVVTHDITITDSAGAADDLALPFGNVAVNGNANGTVTVTNSGVFGFSIGLATGDPLTAPFSISDPSTCFGVTLGPGDDCTLAIHFDPVAEGLAEQSFTLDFGSSTAEIDVSGTGVGPAEGFSITKRAIAPSGGETMTASELDRLTYRLTVTNDSLGDQDVTVTDLLPAEVDYVSDTGSYDLDTGIWDVGLVSNTPPDNTASLDIEVDVPAGSDGSVITNTATITEVGGEATAISSSSTVAVGGTNLEIVVDVFLFNDNSFGVDVDYTVTVTNRGPLDVDNLWIRGSNVLSPDDEDEEMTPYISGSNIDPPSFCGDLIEEAFPGTNTYVKSCRIGTLNARQTVASRWIFRLRNFPVELTMDYIFDLATGPDLDGLATAVAGALGLPVSVIGEVVLPARENAQPGGGGGGGGCFINTLGGDLGALLVP